MNIRIKSTTLNTGIILLSALLASCGGGSGDSMPTDTGNNPVDGGQTITPVGNTPDVAGGGTSTPTQSGPSTIDLTDASLITSATKAETAITARSGQGFSFPAIDMQNGQIQMTIPGGELPKFPARRTVSEGTGPIIEFGDPVTLKYDMFAWSNGELVESSSLFEEAHTVKGGVSDEFPIPAYLAKSLLGRNLGDTIQVVLPAGTTDLPAYLDQEDAYVLVLELL